MNWIIVSLSIFFTTFLIWTRCKFLLSFEDVITLLYRVTIFSFYNKMSSFSLAWSLSSQSQWHIKLKSMFLLTYSPWGPYLALLWNPCPWSPLGWPWPFLEPRSHWFHFYCETDFALFPPAFPQSLKITSQFTWQWIISRLGWRVNIPFMNINSELDISKYLLNTDRIYHHYHATLTFHVSDCFIKVGLQVCGIVPQRHSFLLQRSRLKFGSSRLNKPTIYNERKCFSIIKPFLPGKITKIYFEEFSNIQKKCIYMNLYCELIT